MFIETLRLDDRQFPRVKQPLPALPPPARRPARTSGEGWARCATGCRTTPTLLIELGGHSEAKTRLWSIF